MKILATLPDNMLNLSVHEMMEATRDFGLSKHEGTFKLDINLNDFWEIDNLDYDIIHIHWPEALVDWKIPTENDIKKLNNRLKQLKTQEKKIIITRHNAIPHTKTKLDAALYKTAFSFADAIFHMEKFSYNEYKEFYGEFNWYTKQKHFFFLFLNDEIIDCTEKRKIILDRRPGKITGNKYFNFQNLACLVYSFG